MAQSITQKVQAILGVKTDGVWGPASQDALNAEKLGLKPGNLWPCEWEWVV